jgi:NAD(P)-dependent dehydrogenase (short-subunit alcohol dehydrogenase family)
MGILEDGVAVITGAGSGMGRCLAQKLAARGSSLALSDINEKGLSETSELLAGSKGKVTQHLVNVAEESQVKSFAEEVQRQHGRATILFNNAGVALLGDLDEISLQDFRWLMDINFWGVVYGVTYFLPMLKKEKRAHIVNTSSLLGFFGASGQGAYCASKFAVRGYTESLHHELLATNVGVTCVHPGFFRKATEPFSLRAGGSHRRRDRRRQNPSWRGATQSPGSDRPGRLLRRFLAAPQARQLLESARQTVHRPGSESEVNGFLGSVNFKQRGQGNGIR